MRVSYNGFLCQPSKLKMRVRFPLPAPESDFQTKHRLSGGTRFARPTLSGLPYLFLQNWSVFTTSLEPILSKIRNDD